MAFDQIKLEISLLLTEMQNEPEDRHEIYLSLREKLNQLKATGMPLPEDLVTLERELEKEFAEEQREGE
ncbi:MULTISPECIES: hypothetical protein [unclassified Hyphomicrobium]|uniref:hypothetical protein n=1 Tax=unclassified Hyphomicrobium TaxID=2619925 RepID=UPI000213ED06|nr:MULTISPECIES: hypothetical protein [unclassified Hyphomicrobium]CCB64110.1 conserved protein of unknown function [Hyphomicrobium sp. MC1]